MTKPSTPQIYPDEDHSLSNVRKHLFRTMSAFLDDCFRKQVPPETKAGLRNGGNLDWDSWRDEELYSW